MERNVTDTQHMTRGNNMTVVARVLSSSSESGALPVDFTCRSSDQI